MSLTEEAIDKIKEMIVSGALKPGDRMPKEADLALRLGLSRNSLREAVSALSLIRVLDVRQGDGTYVTSLEPSLLLDAMRFIVDFHRDDSMLQMFEARRAIEPAVAAIAAERMTAEEVAGLRALIDDVPLTSPPEDFVRNDLEFHRRIAAGTGNSVLCSIVESVSAPTVRARVWRARIQQAALDRTLAEHRTICDAIAAHNAQIAASAMAVHISGVEEWLKTELRPATA